MNTLKYHIFIFIRERQIVAFCAENASVRWQAFDTVVPSCYTLARGQLP